MLKYRKDFPKYFGYEPPVPLIKLKWFEPGRPCRLKHVSFAITSDTSVNTSETKKAKTTRLGLLSSGHSGLFLGVKRSEHEADHLPLSKSNV
jgi:hypothetical protein